MSTKTIQSMEFTCDGACGAKKTTAINSAGAGALPNGWSVLTEVGEAKHFCDTCTSLMKLPLYNQERQLRILNVLTVHELSDFDLEDLHEKLTEAEKKKLASGPRFSTPGGR